MSIHKFVKEVNVSSEELREWLLTVAKEHLSQEGGVDVSVVPITEKESKIIATAKGDYGEMDLFRLEELLKAWYGEPPMPPKREYSEVDFRCEALRRLKREAEKRGEKITNSQLARLAYEQLGLTKADGVTPIDEQDVKNCRKRVNRKLPG